MKICIESTSQIVEVNGVPARVWHGQTAAGVKVQCLITRLAVHNSEEQAQFEAELESCAAPRSLDSAFPLRLIL